MTATEAQAALRAIAFDLVRLEERCQGVLDSLPRSENEAAMFEGSIPWDLPTELQTVLESLLEGEIRPAIESLERASQVTEEDLRREFRPGELKRRERQPDCPTLLGNRFNSPRRRH